jgi:two-component system, chemotaxis family, CheB/CheR fusion protein
MSTAVAGSERVAPPQRKPDFYVIGIGASGGGPDALRTFFARMPPVPGFACVVVVHLSPEHESHLVELLQPCSRMPVCQVIRTTALEPNHVYVIPPNANLNSIDTHLRLSELEARRIERAPIDHFLRTLAATHGETAVGVILSGAGSDGSLGIRQIKGRGGLTIAQDPREAEYSSMPQSAIASGMIDRVLPLRDMADEIAGYCATRPMVQASETNDALAPGDASLLERILGELRLHTGHEFSMYTHASVLQRVRRRMRLRRVATLAEYFEVLSDNADEPAALCNDLLLNVTEFFRDPETVELLERILGEIVSRKSPVVRVRAWSIGCSTGEEVYSLAMLLVEQASRDAEEPPWLQVFASELSPLALQQAREGIYPQEVAAAISESRLERFFVRETGHYRVRRELRDIVTFANHDLFKDPPYAHLDLIVCCSLLSKLRDDVRRAVIELFGYALEPHGVLLLDAEDEIENPDGFIRDSSRPRLLRRISGPPRSPELGVEVAPFARLSGERSGSPLVARSPGIAETFRCAIERYTPPSVLIDAKSACVLHFSATASRYVRIPGGELTLDLLKLVPETIAYRLRGGLSAIREGARSWQSGIFGALAGGTVRRMIVRIDRVDDTVHNSGMLLVVLDDSVDQLPSDEKKSASGSMIQVLTLQRELARAHEELAALVGQRAATSEGGAESSQELRAVVEELEDAREELQAVNEELITLNDENQRRVEMLSHVTNDLQHLLEATGLATLLVDCQLNVMRFTPLAGELFRLKPGDIGRPLSDLRHQLRHESLAEEARRVIEHLVEIELVVGAGNRWFLLRIQPYRTPLRGLEGAVLVFVDITDRRNAELSLREADRRKDEFIAVLAHELRNPLAPIGAGIEVLRKLPDDPTLVRQVVATIGRQSQLLVRLVDDLLEVSRISGGKLTLRITPVRIAEVVRDAISAVRPVLESLQHELTVAVPDEPLVVDGDAARLTQVVGNLLHNAGRYTPSGGKISLAARRVDGKVEISVRDNGLGITPQSLPNVFDMFFQGGEAATTNNSGLGIGLTLAKKLVEMHAGTIRAESGGRNMGSTFTVQLPLARPPASSGVSAAEPEANLPGEKQRVLIVDDNADAAETLRLLMTTMGSGEVRTASNGVEALTVGAQLRPDVVLLDLGMPDMDGYEVARRMRGESWGKGALLVALTGWGQEAHRHRSKEAGFDRHLTKPADPEALRAVLRHTPVH